MNLSNVNRLAASGLLAWTAVVTPAGAEPVPLSREAAVQQALRDNRELQVAAFEVAAAKVRMKWAGKLEPPELEASGQNDRLGLDDDETVFKIGIAQRFPLTSRLRREKALTRVQVALAETEITEHRRRLIGRIERAWIAATASGEGASLLKAMHDHHEEHIEVLARQVEAGAISRLELNQARLELKTLEQKYRRQESESTQLLAALKTLLGLPEETPVTLARLDALPESSPATVDPAKALEKRPDFQSAVLKEDEALAELALAEANRWEDVAIRLFAEREDSVDEPSGLDRNTFIGVGVSIPLPLKKKRATAEETVARDKAVATTRALALSIPNEVAAAARRRADLQALAVEASGETLDLAEENLEEIRKAYENGQYELIKYQRAQEQLLEARLAALEARLAWQLAEAALREAAATHPSIQPESPSRSK